VIIGIFITALVIYQMDLVSPLISTKDQAKNQWPSLCNTPVRMIKMKGYPKTGTTYFEYLIEGFIRTVCNHTSRCEVSGHPRRTALWVREYEEEKIEGQSPRIRCRWGFTVTNKHEEVPPIGRLSSRTRFIYTVRDPRDVAISQSAWAHQLLSNYFEKGRFEYLLRKMGRNYEKALERGALILSYERMKTEPLALLSLLDVFLGFESEESFLQRYSEESESWNVSYLSSAEGWQKGPHCGESKGWKDVSIHSKELGPKLLDRLSFESMKSALANSTGILGDETSFRGLRPNEKMRSGQVGGFRQSLDPSMVDSLDSIMKGQILSIEKDGNKSDDPSFPSSTSFSYLLQTFLNPPYSNKNPICS